MGKWFHHVASIIANFFSGHQAQIKTAISYAQVAVADAAAVSSATGHDTKLLKGASDGLSQIDTTITAETSATTLAEHVQNLTRLVTNLAVASNDIGIKNAETKAKVGDALTKINHVIGALESAHEAAAGAIPTPPPAPPTAPGN